MLDFMSEVSNEQAIRIPDKVYIAGKITGDPNYRAKFEHAQYIIEWLGYRVFNPTSIKIENGSWEDYMRVAIGELLKCDCIQLLPDWQDSKGARIENTIASIVGIRRLYVY